jgi:hypothetical protein
VERIMWFLSLLLFICCVMFIDLHMLNHPSIPGMKPTWLRCMIFLIGCWIFCQYLVKYNCIYIH